MSVVFWLLIFAPIVFLLGREVVRVHREITACQEATERFLRAEAERFRIKREMKLLQTEAERLRNRGDR